MIEIDGPPMAWFEDADGNKHIYKTYALKSKSHVALLQSYAKWYQDMGCQQDILVWRTRPCHTEEDGWHTLYFRAVIMLMDHTWPWPTPEKAEGAPANKVM